MNKFFTLITICGLALAVNAQPQSVTPTSQPYGKVDKADLDLTSCEFEKDAHAEVLFDKGTVYFTQDYDLVFERHIRIKIFTEEGKNYGSARIEYRGGDKSEYLSNFQGETINSDNGVIKITKIDKKQIFTQSVDKIASVLSFAFPDVKPGSIIEYKYSITTPYLSLFPDWYFQREIPTRYSELNTSVPSYFYYKNLVMVTQPYVKNTDEIKALANIPSINEEPFMSSERDNSQRILYELKSINAPGYFKGFSDSWHKVGEEVCDFDDYGGQFRKKLTGEEEIINKAKSLKSDGEKIEYIFEEVKKQMKWDKSDRWYTSDGTQDAWDKKTGNSTEVNLILCHLLQKSGINALPMLVSTRKNGKVNPAFPSKWQFNKTVAYIPVDTANYYILDATNKYNAFNETPANLLNAFGFWIDKENKKYDIFFLQKTTPVRQMVLINAEIKPDGKMTGSAQMNSFSYNRLSEVEKYKIDGEEKYKEYLTEGDNNLKISAVKFDNMEIDTLPLTQNVDFNLTLSGSDENYIYFSPNLFTGLHVNPFLNENRLSDIDFGYLRFYSINGIYKLPGGFKTDALPKSVSMAMSDGSIVFKRIVAEQDGSILIRYTIDYKKSIFFKENYGELHEFFKKMHEMLNEQIVLKKA
jgi:hypothetical protein